MEVRYFKEYSHNLDREMEFKIYGNGGKLCLAFPPQDGRFFDFENYGMVETIRPWIEEGRVMVVGVDAIDGETWSSGGDPRQRLERRHRHGRDDGSPEHHLEDAKPGFRRQRKGLGKGPGHRGRCDQGGQRRDGLCGR